MTTNEEYARNQKFILDTLQEIKQELKDDMRLIQKELKEETRILHKDLSQVQTEVALLKLKASLWGGLAGVLAYVTTFLIEYFRRR